MALAFLMCNLETSILPKPWLAVKIFPKLDKLPVSHKLNLESHKIICSLKTKFFASSTSSGIMSRCWSQPHWCEKPAFTEFLWLQRKCLLSDGGFNIPTCSMLHDMPFKFHFSHYHFLFLCYTFLPLGQFLLWNTPVSQNAMWNCY